ncbi:MAG: EAL domain-containing protein, partial [Acidimicrobiales bacterium]
HRLTTVTALQRATREGHLRLAYQPIVDRQDRLIGAEALLRWDHDGELLSPARFLELAEDTGLILPMGAWVLGQACSDLESIKCSIPALRWISVNMSSRQLLDERLPLLIHRAMQTHEIPARSIAIEIAEETLREDDGRAASVLSELTDIAVMLSLADLATDQAVLQRIDTLPIDTIKLDRGFVQQLDVDVDGHFRSLAMAVLELASEAGISVIAEGVETESQAKILRDLGCPHFQGFRYGAPLDLASFITRASA